MEKKLRKKTLGFGKHKVKIYNKKEAREEAAKRINTNNTRKLIYGSYLGYKAVKYIIGMGGAATRHATQNLENNKKAKLYATAALAGIGATSILTIKNARDSYNDIKSTNSYYKRHKNDFKRKKKKN